MDLERLYQAWQRRPRALAALEMSARYHQLDLAQRQVQYAAVYVDLASDVHYFTLAITGFQIAPVEALHAYQALADTALGRQVSIVLLFFSSHSYNRHECNLNLLTVGACR